MRASFRKETGITKGRPPPPTRQALVRPPALPFKPPQVDYRLGVHPTDAIEAEVRQELLACRARRDPFVSQEFVANVNLGRGMDPEKYRDRCVRNECLQQQTEDLAAALERTGLRVRRNAEVMGVGVFTAARELSNNYRPICFFPIVAQRQRRPMLNELFLFRRAHPNHRKFLRYAVITAGRPIPLLGLPPAEPSSELARADYFELRDRLSELSRSVSRFAQWANQAYDVDVVFRGLEFTVKQRPGDDFVSAHPHANVLYTPRHLLDESEWNGFLAGAAAHFHGWWWKDCGKLECANEAMKYVVKPTDLGGLEDLQVRYLHEQTFGLPIMEPLGSFRSWRKETFWTVEVGADGQARSRKHRRVATTEYAAGARLEICSVRKRIRRPRTLHKIVRHDQEPRENVLLGYTMPQRRFSPWAEPIALVLNYTTTPQTAAGQDTLDAIANERQRLQPIWDMNGAPDPAIALAVGRAWAAAREDEAGDVVPFSVHTRNSTAGPRTSRGPPISVSATEAVEWQQLGVDFSVSQDVFEA